MSLYRNRIIKLEIIDTKLKYEIGISSTNFHEKNYLCEVFVRKIMSTIAALFGIIGSILGIVEFGIYLREMRKQTIQKQTEIDLLEKISCALEIIKNK